MVPKGSRARTATPRIAALAYVRQRTGGLITIPGGLKKAATGLNTGMNFLQEHPGNLLYITGKYVAHSLGGHLYVFTLPVGC